MIFGTRKRARILEEMRQAELRPLLVDIPISIERPGQITTRPRPFLLQLLAQPIEDENGLWVYDGPFKPLVREGR